MRHRFKLPVTEANLEDIWRNRLEMPNGLLAYINGSERLAFEDKIRLSG
jgi:hypothetical protein